MHEYLFVIGYDHRVSTIVRLQAFKLPSTHLLHLQTQIKWHVIKINKTFCLHLDYALWKYGSMHARKVLSQISWCSLHRLIRDDTFLFNGICQSFLFAKIECQSFFFAKIELRQKVSFLISLCRLHMLISDDTLRTCVKPLFFTEHSPFVWPFTVGKGFPVIPYLSWLNASKILFQLKKIWLKFLLNTRSCI